MHLYRRHKHNETRTRQSTVYRLIQGQPIQATIRFATTSHIDEAYLGNVVVLTESLQLGIEFIDSILVGRGRHFGNPIGKLCQTQ